MAAATRVARAPRRPRINLKRTLGPVVAEWMEANLVRGPGDVKGEPFELDSEELQYLFAAYAIDDRGRRVVRRGVYSRPKGRRKSEFAGALCCAEALGPVRFGGWDRRGYPRGRPVTSPFVRINATEEGQTGNTYDNVFVMLSEGPLAATPGLDVGLTRVYLPGGGEIRVSTAAAASKDGGKESFTVFDEPHLYVSPELHQLHRTVMRNLAKRRIAQPWAHETTTMFEPGAGSVAELAFEHWKKIAAGEITDRGFLFDHRQAPRVVDFEDVDELRGALEYVYGPAAEWVDIDRIIEDYHGPDLSTQELARYFLNQPWSTVERGLIDLDEWDAMSVDTDPLGFIPEESAVFLGLDGSRSHDQAAIAHATAPDAHGVVRADVLIADSNRHRLPDDPASPHIFHAGGIDYDDLADTITDRFVTYRVEEAAYGADYVHDAVRVVDRRLPKAKVAQIPRTSKLERMALAGLELVLHGGKFRIRRDPVLRRQIANTEVIRDARSRAILRLRPRRDTDPINAVYALGFAVWLATRQRRKKTWGVAK